MVASCQATEAVMSSYKKFGDGAADVLPLAGLSKRRVRAPAVALTHLVWKVSTANLESDAPLHPDGEIYRVTYDQIDDFPEGEPIDPVAADRIIATCRAAAHKRALPVSGGGTLP
ncbi:hypothetical protein [Shinella sp.]|uniref:hypothetical protein n=1 Tax=Shinella sp. TaxID=1870904 RepID=UPI003F701BB9